MSSLSIPSTGYPALGACNPVIRQNDEETVKKARKGDEVFFAVTAVLLYFALHKNRSFNLVYCDVENSGFHHNRSIDLTVF